MDHLPYPVNPTLPPVSVPYICEGVDPYDARGFVDFPVRRGWMAMTYQTGWCECAPDIAAVRAQTWLYFGVLYEFFGSDFLRPMFIRDDIVNSQDVLTTQALPYLLKTWFNKTSQRTENSNAKIRALLLAAERYSEPLDSLVPSARVISLSIKVLICSLGTAAGVIDSGIRKNETFNASPSRLLEERMLELNWCPYWVKVYVEKYSVPTVNYLSAITRTTMPEDHRACKPSKCVAHNVDMQHYETKHVLDGCNCHFVGPDIGKVIASIQEGSVPLIRCKEAPNGNMFLDVIDADPGVEYTAISHVWSGGLGNPTTNALPECQLRMLTKRMQQISGVESEWFWFRLVERGFKYMNVSSRTRLKNFFLSWGAASHQQSQTAFWLDTLCVPAAEEYLTLRRKAICQMAFIYAGADRVLVLDPELQKIAKGNMPNEQVCAYLASCAWRSRCWPYQEGRLAKDRLYLLKDDLYHHSVGLRQIRRANRDFKMGRLMLNDKALVHSALAAFWEDMDDVKSSENEKENLNEFIKSWNSLGLRSTTKLEDLHSILAVLLGLSSKEILSLELKERMKAIFYAQALLPIALLYVPQFGERVYDVKNQWIPQYPSGHLTLRYGSMRLSVDGEALTFSPADSLSCGFLVNPMKSVLPRFCLIDDASSEKIWIQLTGIHNKELEALYGGSSVCYVLYNHIAKFQPFSSGSNSVGARFYVSRQNSESEVHLIYDCPLKYTYKRPLDENVDLLQLYDYPEVQGQRTRADITFFLDCGMYRRLPVSGSA